MLKFVSHPNSMFSTGCKQNNNEDNEVLKIFKSNEICRPRLFPKDNSVNVYSCEKASRVRHLRPVPRTLCLHTLHCKNISNWKTTNWHCSHITFFILPKFLILLIVFWKTNITIYCTLEALVRFYFCSCLCHVFPRALRLWKVWRGLDSVPAQWQADWTEYQSCDECISGIDCEVTYFSCKIHFFCWVVQCNMFVRANTFKQIHSSWDTHTHILVSKVRRKTICLRCNTHTHILNSVRDNSISAAPIYANSRCSNFLLM